MPPQSRNKPESKQGLVITLVFFILMTLGLGVSTYFGFSEQEKYIQEAKKAKDAEKVFKEERDWYKFQAGMYRVYMGQAKTLEGADQLGVQKGQFDQNVMKGGKDKEDVKKLLQEMDKRFGWNGNGPKETYESQLNKWRTDYDALAKKNEGLDKANATAKKNWDKKNAELLAAEEEYKKNLDAQKVKAATDQKNLTDQLDSLRASVKNQTDLTSKTQITAKNDTDKLKGQITKLKDELSFARKQIAAQHTALEEYHAKSAQAPPSMRTDWKIVRMDRRGLNPYINLGSTDHVKTQLTFTIHGVGVDGRPIQQPKGTLEVVNVLGPHLSQAHVTSVKDIDRDPIVQGDVIYNASWNPTIKKHIALAGIMDITGDGRNSMMEFIRNLRRQNIVVDSYQDPKDGTIKGGRITFRTDFLVLGGSQVFSPTGRMNKDEEKLREGTASMKAEAKLHDVKSVPLNKYLEMIGYRLPRSTGAGQERPSLYDPRLRPDLKPRLGVEKPPPMKPDK